MDWIFFINKQKEPDVPDKMEVGEEASKLLIEIERAKREWDQTQMIFDWANDPEMVDYAIYAMGAAERKYMYLLNKAKRLGFKEAN